MSQIVHVPAEPLQLKGKPLKLVDFPKNLPDDFTEQQFVDLINQVIDLKQIAALSERERSILYSGAQYLADYILLAQEAMGEVEVNKGRPVIGYDGPFIPTILQRPDGVEADFAALENFGVGEGEKYFGEDDA
jgi:hypothetical protein